MELRRKTLGPAVRLTYVKSDKFKTGFLSGSFIVPVEKTTFGMDSLLASVLRRGSEKYPDMKEISEALDILYGARLDSLVRRKAERLCPGFAASFIDDRYIPGGERLLEPAAEMMGELMLHPLLENGAFRADYVEQEKENLLDEIRSRINDKREWAGLRLMQELCAGEPYGIIKEEEDVRDITPAQLYQRYLDIISHAPLELFYCGSAEPERVEEVLRGMLRDLPRSSILTLPPVLPHRGRMSVQRVCERMDITQGKLAMGFSCASEDIPAMIAANALFGGTSNSKLFMNVRERLSLCYYASSSFHMSKRLITVYSGVEFKDYERARDEILAQLSALQRGVLEPWELPGARRTLIGGFRAAADSQGQLENFTLGESAVGSERTLKDYLGELETVSLERIIKAAQSIRLDTEYFLDGEESVE